MWTLSVINLQPSEVDNARDGHVFELCIGYNMVYGSLCECNEP